MLNVIPHILALIIILAALNHPVVGVVAPIQMLFAAKLEIHVVHPGKIAEETDALQVWKREKSIISDWICSMH